MDKIFVQIASYRDPELVPTIQSCMENCSDPSRLRFGIVWQYHEQDAFNKQFEPYLEHPQFEVMPVVWNESKGMCWARSHTQYMWQAETYTLQLDSHMRFAQNWDLFLIECMHMTGSEKPLLTAYCGAYEAENPDYPLTEQPFQMIPTKFSDHGTIPFIATSMHQVPVAPVPARFVSGHFFFTLGQHCREYLYDPELYFAGDEISLSIRSYTLGYDLYHPHRNVIWHDYCSYERRKHWGDHTNTEPEVTTAWWERDRISKSRLRQLLGEEYNGHQLEPYGLGTKRSHAEYEAYAGIDFARRRLHPDAVNGRLPPTFQLGDKKWVDLESTYVIDFSVLKRQVAYHNPVKYYVGFDTTENRAIYHEYFEHLPDTHKFTFNCIEQPSKVVLFGLNASGEFSARTEQLL